MNRWAVALILFPAALLLAALGVHWQTQGGQGNEEWVILIVAGTTIFLVLAMYASQMVSRAGRAILVTVALALDGVLGFALWSSLNPTTVQVASG
jgi:hypothetical protein